MARHQPAKTGTGEPLSPKVKMRLDEKGRFVPVHEERDLTETTEAAERLLARALCRLDGVLERQERPWWRFW